jgi:hypothetical protein
MRGVILNSDHVSAVPLVAHSSSLLKNPEI